MRLGGDERQSAFRAQAARRRVSDGRWAGEVIFLGFPGAQEAGTACRAARINWAGSPEQRGGARFGHRAASRLGQVFAGKGLTRRGDGRPESVSRHESSSKSAHTLGQTVHAIFNGLRTV